MASIIPVLMFGLVIVVIIASAMAAQRRRKALAEFAMRFGLRFSPDKVRSMDDRFRFLSALQHGHSRYAYNTISGVYQGHEVLLFDYHYAVKSNKHTHHYHFSFFVHFLPIRCPEFTIVREGIFSKIAQTIGFDDIDFESAEFSRRYCVRSKDKKFAYDVCNARMIDYLLRNEDVNLEIENEVLAMKFGRCLSPVDIEANLNRLIQIRELLPRYLFGDGERA